MADETRRATAVAAKIRRSISVLADVAVIAPEMKRGLYDAACLLMCVGDLYSAAMNARWEAEIEGDDSPNPAALKEAADAVAKVALAVVTEELDEAGEVGRVFKAAQTRAGSTDARDGGGSPLLHGDIPGWLARARVGARRDA